MIGVLATLPSGGAILANIGSYSNPIFEELMPFLWLIFGLVFAPLLIIVLIRAIGTLVHK